MPEQDQNDSKISKVTRDNSNVHRTIDLAACCLGRQSQYRLTSPPDFPFCLRHHDSFGELQPILSSCTFWKVMRSFRRSEPIFSSPKHIRCSGTTPARTVGVTSIDEYFKLSRTPRRLSWGSGEFDFCASSTGGQTARRGFSVDHFQRMFNRSGGRRMRRKKRKIGYDSE